MDPTEVEICDKERERERDFVQEDEYRDREDNDGRIAPDTHASTTKSDTLSFTKCFLMTTQSENEI